MAALDELLKIMVQRGAKRAVLVSDSPSQLFVGGCQLNGATLSHLDLMDIILEAAPQLRPSLSRQVTFQFAYRSPYGTFHFTVERISGTLQVSIEPAQMPTPLQSTHRWVDTAQIPASPVYNQPPKTTANTPSKPVNQPLGTSPSNAHAIKPAVKAQQPIVAATTSQNAAQSKGSGGSPAWGFFSAVMFFLWLLRSCGSSNTTPQYSPDPSQTYNPPTQTYNPPAPSSPDTTQYSAVEVSAYYATQQLVKQRIPNSATARFAPIGEFGFVATVTPNLYETSIHVEYLDRSALWQSDDYNFDLLYYPDSQFWQPLTQDEVLRLQGK